MNIAALIKTATGGAFDAQDAFNRSGRIGPGVLGPLDARAVEAALALRQRVGGEVTVVAIAGADTLGALREALALGADRAVVLNDPQLEAADLMSRARTAAALFRQLKIDVGLYCPWSGDVDGTVFWSATAHRLHMPLLAQARALAGIEGGLEISRQVEGADLRIAARFPCLVELTDALPPARRASIKARQAARAKPFAMLALGDLAEPPSLHPKRSDCSQRTARARPPPVIIDDAEAAVAAFVAFLGQPGMT
jgi:electron transfer flavoprotein beta subunit